MRMIVQRERGFTLLEVLVTLVIFGVGMLGVAAMQMTALTGLDSSQHRSTAALKASELAERARANPLGKYETTAAAHGTCRSTHYTDTHAAATVCTPEVLAADDLWDWNAELAARLPDGAGVICRDNTPDDGTPTAPACDGGDAARPVLTVKVWWREKARAPGDVPVKRLTISMVP